MPERFSMHPPFELELASEKIILVMMDLYLNLWPLKVSTLSFQNFKSRLT